VNDAPVLAHAGPSASMHGSTVLDPDLTVSDTGLDSLNGGAGNYAGATFTIERQGGGSPDDGFYIDSSSGITVGANNVLQINGQTFATASVANDSLTISFTSSGTIATSALVDSLLQHIGYENSAAAPGSNVTLDYTFNDGAPHFESNAGHSTATASIQVDITGPVFAHETSSVYAPPNLGAVLEPSLTVSDPDLDKLNGGAGNYDGATFTIERDGGGNPDDQYFIDDTSGGISLSGSNIEINGQTVATAGASGGVLTVDFNSSATTADVDDVMEHLGYANTSATPPDSVTLDYTFDDGSATATASVQAFVGIACYCAGTLILADHGEVAVETLQIGDRVITASGVARPIKWIGKRSYGGRFIMGRKDILPICFKTGSLGDGVPKRDLWISPHHAMYLQGVLIEARDLVNELTVTQAEQVDEVEYFHIELESHDVIVAEGALSETFVDDDSRSMFNNAHEYKGLYPDAAVAEARYCAPRVRDGYQIEAVRRAIDARAGRRASRVSAPTLRGNIDVMGAGRIAGWAQNPDYPEMPVCLDILSDGQLIGQVLANRYRADLETAGLGSGRHGFEFIPPRELRLSANTVEVRRSLDGKLLPVPRAA
jgi:Hint domain